MKLIILVSLLADLGEQMQRAARVKQAWQSDVPV